MERRRGRHDVASGATILLVAALTSCGGDDPTTAPEASRPAEVPSASDHSASRVGTDPSMPSSVPDDVRQPAGRDTSRTGEQIGSGSIGPPIEEPEPWAIGTIYADVEPRTLLVEFAPPDRECVAAEAHATIGRGGAVLVSLWVDRGRVDGPCPDGVGGAKGEPANRIRIRLSEPLGDRRIYTRSIADTSGASESAERLADAIIGLDATEAIEVIRAEGFEVRDITDADVVESDFDPGRINISIVDGVVDFAAVY